MRVSVNGVNMANAYTLLSGMTPFSRWGLPPASEIKFTAKRTRNHLCYGEYLTANGKHEIVIYTHINNLTLTLETLAHEMCHLKQELNGTLHPTPENNFGHGPDFRRLAAMVCRQFGIDLGPFIAP